jgi:hypothetical protein
MGGQPGADQAGNGVERGDVAQHARAQAQP